MSYREKNNISRRKCYEKRQIKEMSLKYELFATRHHAQTTKHLTWHWSCVPEDELFKCGWIHDFNKWRMIKRLEMKLADKKLQEYGLDGLSKDHEGHYHGLQDKYYLSRKLSANDLGSFYQTIFRRLKRKDPQNSGYVYHSCDLQVDLKDDNKLDGEDIKFIKLPWSQKHKPVDVIDPSSFDLYEHQKLALTDLLKGWEGPGLLNMPCSTGKTVVLGSFLREKQFKVVVVLSPTRVLAKQNFDRIKTFLQGYECMLIDCDTDGTRCVDQVKECLGKHPFVFMSSTYKSIDVISEAMVDYHGAFVGVDECHNATDVVHEFVGNFTLCLHMSATPASILEIPVVHELSFKEAIQSGLIADYQLYIPCVTKTSGVEVELEGLNKDFAVQAEFLATGMLRTGSRRCISFHRTQDDARMFNETIRRVFEKYHNEAFQGYVVVDSVSQKDRLNILSEFDDLDLIGSHYSVISSVRVLDEGVDMPLCDSVFFADPAESLKDGSKRRAIQRLHRATRKHDAFPQKVAKCFMYCDDMHVLGKTLQILKMNDVDFGIKVKTLSKNYDNVGDAEVREKEAETNVEFGRYVVSLRRYGSTIDAKVMCLITDFKKTRPIRGKIVPVRIDPDHVVDTDMDCFVRGISGNWRNAGYTMLLSMEQMQLIETLCEWFPDCLQAWRAIWKKKDGMYLPTVADKVEALVRFWPNESPKHSNKYIKVQLDDLRVFETNMCEFVQSISRNWKSDRKYCTKLSSGQMEVIENNCLWFSDYIKRRIFIWKSKENTYTPTVNDKVEALLKICVEKRPLCTREIEVRLDDKRVFLFNAGCFVKGISRNWKYDGSQQTKISEDQMRLVESTCEWFPDCLRQWKTQWGSTKGTYQPSTDEKVKALVQLCSDKRPKTGEVFEVELDDVRKFRCDMGSFVQSICGNWKSFGYKRTKISPDQMKIIETGCTWFKDSLAQWQTQWESKMETYQPTVNDKVGAILTMCADERPIRKSIHVRLDDDRVFDTDLSMFVKSISGNWNPEGGALTKLTREQMTSIEQTCTWFPSCLKTWKTCWEKRKKNYQPSVSDKVEALLKYCIDDRPRVKQVFDVQLDEERVFKTKLNIFMNSISNNWTGNGYIKTKLSPEQMEMIEKTCTWFDENLKRWRTDGESA